MFCLIKHYTFRYTIFAYILFACSESPTIFKDFELVFDVDAEVTETWISLRAPEVKRGAVYTVMRDSTVIFNNTLSTNDTLLHDENLEPKTSYTYSAYARQNGEKSETVTTIATTMDTTSHDFSWEVTKISDRLDIRLHDVSIINENNIYVVGHIPNPEGDNYNVVHWDGTKWNLERIILKTNVGPDGPYEIKTVFANSKNNIWIARAEVHMAIGMEQDG